MKLPSIGQCQLSVCHVSTMTSWGGVERMLADLLTHIDQSRICHLLLSPSSIPEVVRPIRRAGIPIFQPRRYFHYDPSTIIRMARWMQLQQVHVAHSYNAYANSWGNLAALMAQTPVFVSSEHGSAWWIRAPRAWLDRWAHHRSQLIIANSHASATVLCLRYGSVLAEKTRVVHNGVPPLPKADIGQLRRELNISSKLVVGSVGRLDGPKDFATLIDAAALVLKSRRDVHFVLVGGGLLEGELREHINRLGIADAFTLTGWRADARAVVQIFDVFVSTSVHETFGNALVEAALAGVPVIAPRIDGIPEVVEDLTTGILLAPTEPLSPLKTKLTTPLPRHVLVDGKLQSPRSLNPRDLADTVLYLLDHAILRRQYGSAARKRAETMFSISRYRQDLEEIYLQLGEQKGVYAR